MAISFRALPSWKPGVNYWWHFDCGLWEVLVELPNGLIGLGYGKADVVREKRALRGCILNSLQALLVLRDEVTLVG